MKCSVCNSEAQLWRNVDGFDYSDCRQCDSIALDSVGIAMLDEGTFPRNYSASYWDAEIASSKDRSWGVGLARAAEAMLYCRIPIYKFIDIGTGPGMLLDALSTYLPNSADKFFGIELFPPENYSQHPGYRIGELADQSDMFDCGVCIEMIDHLSPSMLHKLVRALADRSNEQALYIFNTGLSSFTRDQNPDYIDPLNRGHVISWGIPALKQIFEPLGFTIWPLRGKSWAFAAEYMSVDSRDPIDRIWSPNPENRALLHDPNMGSVMHLLGLETARAYS